MAVRSLRRRESGAHDARRAALFLAASVASFATFVAVYLTPANTRLGGILAQIQVFDRSRHARALAASNAALRHISIVSLATLLVVCMAVAVARRRPRLALAVGGAVGCAIVAAEWLKLLVLDPPRYLAGPAASSVNTFPSGHATIAFSLAAAFVLVAPRRWQFAVAVLGWLYATGIAVGTMAAGWHRLGDVVGSALLSFGVFAGACGVLVLWRGGDATREHVDPVGWAAGATVAGGIVVGGALLFIGYQIARNGSLNPLDLLRSHPSGAIVAALTVAGGLITLLLLLAGLSLDQPRREPGRAVSA